jgi:hypothetical protein
MRPGEGVRLHFIGEENLLHVLQADQGLFRCAHSFMNDE